MMNTSARRRIIRRLTALGAVLPIALGGSITSLPATADVQEGAAASKPKPRDVDVRALKPLAPPAEPAALREAVAATSAQLAAPVLWPDPGKSTLRTGELKKEFDRGVAASSSAGPVRPSVEIETFDQQTSSRAGVAGVLYAVKAAGGASQPVQLTFDYSGYATAFGADWASRLTVVKLPVCVTRTPAQGGCTDAKQLTVSKDARQQMLSITVPLSAAQQVFAVTADSKSSNGDYAATQLSPSASWSGGGSSGDFNWSYPFRVPPSTGGPAPKLSLEYSSQSVDGRTAASNNQVSWAGEGFEFTESYIERKYGSCDQEGHVNRFDLCWKYDNASLVLNGKANELVKVGSDAPSGPTRWRLKNDDGSKVEKLIGTVDNGDSNKEYWRITTQDGTEYYFGKHYLGGGLATTVVTNSVYTVPVSSDDTNEPCHKTGFADSFCNEAWRWNLDYVVDTHDNAMSYWYAKETNNYAKSGVASPGTSYVRGGYLERIDYGLRDGALIAKAPQQVVFAPAERCVTVCDSLSSTTRNNWPDVPFDQICNTGSACTNKLAPTFFSRKRLQQITTQVLKGTAYQPVDQWQFTQRFPSTGDGSVGAPMWLGGIAHSGKVGTSIAMPSVLFDGGKLVNRVDTPVDGLNGLWRYRLNKITTETGAVITVGYSAKECDIPSKNMPTEKDTNSKRCYPVRWTPPLEAEREDWFHKYVVDSVTTQDPTGGNGAEMVTWYRYDGGAAWHYQDSPLLKLKDRTWSEWRGYGSVTTYTGHPVNPGPRSKTVTTYFRGMDGDRQEGTNAPPRNVDVRDSEGQLRADADPLAGRQREQIQYQEASSSAEVSGAITDYAIHQTAEQNVSFPGTQEPPFVLRSNFVGQSSSKARTARDGGRPDLVRSVTTEYDTSTGLPIKVADWGDAAKVDETCAITTYVKNVDAWLVLPSRVVTSAGACDTASANPPETRALSDVRTGYDGGGPGDAPTVGNPSTSERLRAYVGGTAQYQVTETKTFDQLGRVTSSKDALNRLTTTTYTPAVGGPLLKSVTTQPEVTVANGTKAKFTTTVEYRPEWGLTWKTTDTNQKTTELDYDALGRLSSVWLPTQPRASNALANMKYSYTLSQTAPSNVRTDTLNHSASGYVTSFAQFDSLLRPRQTQTPAPDGGRVITESRYDSRGLVIFENKDVWNSGSPTAAMVVVPNASVENQTANTYDGAGRVTVSTFQTALQPRWSTATRYGGDTVTVLPPTGAAATATVTDAKGQLIERREYDGNAASGTPIVTQYGYDPAGRMTRMAGAGGVWTYDYDLRGRKISSSDPDSGVTTSTYDEADRLTSTTDSENNKLITTMDALDRRTGLFESTTADVNLQVGWTYDEPGFYGQLSTATRFPDGRGGPAYKSIVMTRNALYKPTSISTVVPAAEGELAGSYHTSVSYAEDQQAVVGAADSGGGGLAPEEIRLTLSPLGLPTSMVGRQTYVAEATYSVLRQVNVLDIGANHDFPIENTWEIGTGRLLRSTAGESVYAANHLYAYDPAGNVVRDHNAVGQDTQCFDYDGHRRLSAAWTPADADCSATPSVDALGGPAPYWQSWTYTPTGLRETQIDHSLTGDRTSTHVYGGSQPHTLTKVERSGAGGPTESVYQYDKRGNTVSRPGDAGSQALDWNAEGKLSKLSTNSGDTEYVYGADGELLLRRGPTETVLHLGNLELTLDRTTRKVIGQRRYSFAGSPIAVRSANGTATSDLSWLVADYHQTGHVAVDPTDLTASKRYAKPFGEPRGETPAIWPSDRNFLDKPEDLRTGLTSVGAREYDVALGRFLSVDPLLDTADPQQMLGYAYANNNPVSMSDPTGLINDCESCGGGGPLPPPPVIHDPDDDDGDSDGGSNNDPSDSIDHPDSPRNNNRKAVWIAQHGVTPQIRGTADVLREIQLPNERQYKNAGHLGLGLCGVASRWGIVCVAANTYWFAKDGDFTNAMWSSAEAIPLGGLAAGLKASGQLGKFAGESSEEAAKKYAAALKSDKSRSQRPTIAAAATSSRTGKTYFGASGDLAAAPAELANRLPNPSREPWSSFNCAEVSACAAALKAGEKLADLDVTAVYVRNGKIRPPCGNCGTWVPN